MKFIPAGLLSVLLLSACAEHNVKCIIYNRSGSSVDVTFTEQFKARRIPRSERPRHQPYHYEKYYYQRSGIALGPGDTLKVDDHYGRAAHRQGSSKK